MGRRRRRGGGERKGCPVRAGVRRLTLRAWTGITGRFRNCRFLGPRHPAPDNRRLLRVAFPLFTLPRGSTIDN
ncbi:unnamed protein product [Sphagnum jensenii]|uniref:Uncharacterized protein n=2 Tax=Sphagnum jensenii TaxID=128206 RepID=A0ABP0V7N4_9BRYO